MKTPEDVNGLGNECAYSQSSKFDGILEWNGMCCDCYSLSFLMGFSF